MRSKISVIKTEIEKNDIGDNAMVSPHYQSDVIAFLKKQPNLSDKVMAVEVVKQIQIHSIFLVTSLHIDFDDENEYLLNFIF